MLDFIVILLNESIVTSFLQLINVFEVTRNGWSNMIGLFLKWCSVGSVSRI